MDQSTKEATRHIDVVLRALDVLDCFQNDAALSLKAIIERAGLTRSRAMRLLGTLESRGYLIENVETRQYHPGIKLAILGKSFQNYNSIEVIIRPVLKQLADETGESATFFVADGIERVALMREEGSHAIRYSIHEGQRLPIAIGASGKILLAFGIPGVLENIPAHEIADRQMLDREIKRIRINGYAVSKGENVPDAHAIAAPVFDNNKRLIGALGIAGPASRLDDVQIKKRVNVVVAAADYLCKRFGENKSPAKRLTKKN